MRLWIEWILLYVLAPGLLALVTVGHRWIVLAAIGAGSIVAFALLPRSELTGGAGNELKPALLRAALAVVALLVLLAVTGQWPSFQLVRERPQVFIGVLVLYPILSAFPQEALYRSLFFHRYGALFPTRASRIVASALVFGWAHVMVHNHLAMLLSALAGVLLSITWVRSRSLLLVGLEHTLYGACLLATGAGGLFVNGIRLMSSILR
jgi:membrane protease YdiL (CAAX protease family)